MSCYSGKCDFKDIIEIHGIEHIMISVMHVGEKDLKVSDPKDFIPYYPYVVAMMAWEKDHGTIWLSKESYVDTEERKSLELYLKIILNIYNRCKKKKIEFTYDLVDKELHYFNQAAIKELYERVKKSGKKAVVDGIKLPLAEYYRERLKEEMKRNGLI